MLFIDGYRITMLGMAKLSYGVGLQHGHHCWNPNRGEADKG